MLGRTKGSECQREIRGPRHRKGKMKDDGVPAGMNAERVE